MKTNVLKRFSHLTRLSCAFGLLFLDACTSRDTSSQSPEGFEVKFLAGSALK